TKDNLAGGGDWYFLAANRGQQLSIASFKATLSGPTVPSRPQVAPPTCDVPWQAGPDAGIDAGFDAGQDTDTDSGTVVEKDAGMDSTPPDSGMAVADAGNCSTPDCTGTLTPRGCGCGAGGVEGAAFLSLLLLGVRLRARRRAE